jgi:hypothetical protein
LIPVSKIDGPAERPEVFSIRVNDIDQSGRIRLVRKNQIGTPKRQRACLQAAGFPKKQLIESDDFIGRAVRLQGLETALVFIPDEKGPARVDIDGIGIIEFARPLTSPADCRNISSLGIEFLDPVVCGVQDIDISRSVQDDVGREVEGEPLSFPRR